ncbi:MATE family efflux transporter [Parabacteroides sp.]
MNNQIYEERLGTDRMLPLIFRMALPAIAAQMVNLLYNIVDRIYIGHIPGIGTPALAGIGVAGSIIILISAFSSIVAGGGAPLAAIALGQGNRQHAGRILGNGFILLLLFTVVTSVLAYIFMEPILLFTGASEQTLGYATDYLSIYLIGTLFVEISIGLNTFINTQGRPSIAMWSVMIGALLNILLDPLFIFGFDMGVKGAALATIISQAGSAIWVLSFLLSSRASLRLESLYMKPDKKVIGAILALGASPFIMASTESLVGFVLNGSLKTFGDIYVSALTVMQSAMLFVSVPLTGFALGFVPIVSYNYGHGNRERVKECFKIVMTFMFLFNFLLIVLMILFPSVVASVFTSDEELIQTVRQVMPVFLAGMTIFGLQRACQNMFVALGQAKISIFIALLRKIFLLIPLALILPRFMGMIGVYAAEGISDATAAICCTIIFAIQFPKILKRMTIFAPETKQK